MGGGAEELVALEIFDEGVCGGAGKVEDTEVGEGGGGGGGFDESLDVGLDLRAKRRQLCAPSEAY